MVRRKRSLDQWPASFEPLDEFDNDEWTALEEVLEREIPEDMLCRLEDQMLWWLSAFRHADEIEYGKEERAKVSKIQNHAKTLMLALDELGKAGEMALDDLCEEHKISRIEWMLCLGEITRLATYFDERLGSVTRPDFAQMHALVSLFDEYGLPTEISRSTYATSFYPSPFVRFVDCLWSLRPELRVYTPRPDDYYPALSQWLAERRDRVRKMQQVEQAGPDS
jgi:hypothetical protein